MWNLKSNVHPRYRWNLNAEQLLQVSEQCYLAFQIDMKIFRNLKKIFYSFSCNFARQFILTIDSAVSTSSIQENPEMEANFPLNNIYIFINSLFLFLFHRSRLKARLCLFKWHCFVCFSIPTTFTENFSPLFLLLVFYFAFNMLCSVQFNGKDGKLWIRKWK